WAAPGRRGPWTIRARASWPSSRPKLEVRRDGPMSGAGTRLFRNRSFRALWLGQFVSIFGDRLHYLALLALIVERAHNPLNPTPELALVPAVSFLPTILIGPLAGALVDSWETRSVLVVSGLLRGCLALLLIPAAAPGGPPAGFLAVTKPRPRQRMPRPATWGGVYRALGRDVREGARISVSNRAVLGSLLALVCLWIAGGALHVAGTVLLRGRMTGFISGTGGILASLGFGMVAGTVVLTWRGARWPRRTLAAIGLIGTGIMLALFTRAASFPALAAVGF